MVSSARGLRVLKALNFYTKGHPDHFDTHNIFKKVNITSLSNGVMKGTFTVDKTMCNLAGCMHGGYIASMLDAFTVYAQLSVPESRMAWTTNLSLNFLKSSKIGEKVVVETSVLKTGRNPIMEAIMTDESGSLLAKSVSSFINGNDSYQKMLKDLLNFDINEN